MPDASHPVRTRGADLLWRALEDLGVTRVFSLSGNHVMAVYDAAFGRPIEIIHVRHEAAALHMADAWARLTGQLGVALVTGGQGHTNACAALPTAMADEVPTLLLSGHAPTDELGLGAFQETPQVALAAPLCKAAWMVEDAASLPAEVARAAAIARAGRPGPVHLSLPTDVLEAEAQPAPVPPAPAAEAPDAAAIAAFLAAAQRPLLLAGPSLNTPDGAAARAALAAATGLPVVMMESPRGLADPSNGDVGALLAQADAVVLLGKQLDFTLRFGRGAARFALIEPDPAIQARARHLLGERLAVLLDAAPLAATRALAAASTPRAADAWVAECRAAIAFRPASWAALETRTGAPIHPVTLAAALRPHLAGEAVLVCDGGEIGQWMMATLSAKERIVNGIAGAIGASIPFAVAASAARPGRPVLAVMGDGTAGFHIAELDTAVRHGLPLVIVVGNDAAWNAELQIQRRDYGADRAHGCTLLPTRYDLVAQGFGAHGEFVQRAEDLAPALARAFASGKPALVNVLIEGQPAPKLAR